ncbi:MAG: HAMP domain-containing histidine kinase [Acidimicrobiia bacterium]|nr:HAMP domain-containing histidine kinase [Acidimicrobiia bacterium]
MTHRSRSIRSRITLLAALIMAVVLGVTSVAVVAIQRQQLFANLDNSLETRADQIAQAIAAGDVVGAGFANTNPEDRFAQLLSPGGEVIDATDNAADVGPLAEMPSGRQSITTDDHLPLEDDGYRVLARRLDMPDGTETLVVGENVDDLRDSLRALTVTMAVVAPLAVVLLALVVWWLVGRTLRPVEAIRREVADIRLNELDRRVPEPPTGDEVARLAGTMNEMLDRLEASNERQQRFVADASHELRTPLTRIRAELEVGLTADDDLTPTCESALEDAVGMQKLIEDLLFLTRSDNATSTLPSERVDLDVIVDREVRQVRERTATIVDMSGVSAATVIGDARQLGRLVRNLLDNATRHAATAVSLTLGCENETVRLVVSDDGPGVPVSDRERIFDRFTRLDDARTPDAGGSGLGLAICREIATAHQGTITVTDATPSGARFVVELPAD